MKLKGSLVALVTPFNSDSSINYSKLSELIEYHISNQTDGIVVLGTTAEASTLSLDEKEKVVAVAAKTINKRVPLIVGSATNDTLESIALSKKFSQMGADYLLVITPYYNKTNQSGLVKHFSQIADAASCPIILYNVPGRTGMSISLDSIEILSKHQNIIGIKEASGDLSYTTKIAKYLSDEFLLFSGNDDIIVPMMAIGASGVISVVANIAPVQTHRICQLCFDGNYLAARKIQLQLLDFINALFIETNPIPIKAALNQLGFNVGLYRLPLDQMSKDNQKYLQDQINKIKGEIY